ncbi:hypothetical protein DdX_15325 [Ditylenchus destructor]|uniref:Uncharacterized protein n=1 Tax=Ditylenchus destructor TaxID=166010 RepID=A0AAD4QXV4_9BILA|nr:hypothetical protein DdX_15325 [Ditylenchus destructor]
MISGAYLIFFWIFLYTNVTNWQVLSRQNAVLFVRIKKTGTAVGNKIACKIELLQQKKKKSFWSGKQAETYDGKIVDIDGTFAKVNFKNVEWRNKRDKKPRMWNVIDETNEYQIKIYLKQPTAAPATVFGAIYLLDLTNPDKILTQGTTVPTNKVDHSTPCNMEMEVFIGFGVPTK